jgi:DNA repair exonuclease SbcCD ATPase subunit
MSGLIEFLWIEIEGFLSVKRARFTFEIGLFGLIGVNDDEGGSNGAGKSTLGESMYWCYFGIFLRDVPKVDAFIHEGMKYAHVKSAFRRDGRIVEVSRSRNHPVHGNGARITVDGSSTDFDRFDSSERDKQILKLLGIGPRQFATTCFFGARIPSFARLKDSEQKRLILRSAGVSYDRPLERAKAALNTVSAEMESSNASVKAIERNLTSLRDSLDKGYKSLADYDKRSSEEVHKYKEILSQKFCEIELLHEEQRSLKNLRNSLSSLSGEERSLDREIRALEGHLAVLSSEFGRVSRELEILEESRCSRCKQDLDPEHVAEHSVDLMTELGRIENVKVQVSDQLKTARANLSIATETRDVERRATDSKLTELENSIKVVNEGLQLQRSAREFIEKLESLRPSPEIVMSLESKIKIEEEKLTSIRGRISTLQPLRKRLEFMVQAFSPTGMVEEALELLLPSINEEVGTICSTLSGGAINTSLKINKRRKLEILAKCRSGGKHLGLMSEGETQRVNLAICFGAAMAGRLRNGGSNFLLIDEGAWGIDEIGAERLISVLEYIQQQIGCVIVISHRAELKNSMPRLIEARKKSGVTTYSEVDAHRVDEFSERI